MDFPLPAAQEAQYKEILAEFAAVRDTYKYYADEMIPVDIELLKKIIAFIIDILSYMEIHYEKLDLERWRGFLHQIIFNFTYGDRQNKHNYLAAEEFDLLTLLEKFARDEDAKPISLIQITSIRKKLEKSLPSIG